MTSARELLLIPKEKYNLLRDKHSTNTTAVGTQTEDIQQTDVQCHTDTTQRAKSDKPYRDITNSEEHLRQTVHSSSWGRVPGIRRKRAEKKSTKRSIKWIPY